MMRTHRCGDLRASHGGETVTLTGWVHHLRDHKGVIFVDLRDVSGSVQVVFHPKNSPEAATTAHEGIDREYCLRVTGQVAMRPPGTVNAKLPTGEVELAATELEVLAPSETPPFVIEDDLEADEIIRLKHRYLDLRRPVMQQRLRLRARVLKVMRDYLDEQGFIDVETPILTRSTPEGARDFLVPSRLQPGTFFALPQSPQIYKQLLMVAGLDRYYQFPSCFRDEDLRADRGLEFRQLDLEMSFVDEDDVMTLTEGLMAAVWRDLLGVELALPFPRISYTDSLARYGSDKPDMRFEIPLVEVSDVFAGTELKIFRGVLDGGGVIKAIAIPGAADHHQHAELRKLEHQAMERGAKGLAWIRFTAEGIDSPLKKVLSESEREGLAKVLGAGPGDLVLMVADKAAIANTVLGALRTLLAKQEGLIPEGDFRFCWVVDPPLFEWSDQERRFVSSHHPFTQPQRGWEQALASGGDPGSAKARAYDIVVNGVELASGSIRIHDRAMQERVFEALGIDQAQAQSRFGFLLDAFRFGPPPHGGIAPGIDRIVMVLAGVDNIREVTAFSKSASGSDPMTGAPTPVDNRQLEELGLRLAPPK
jgi:aspartyl-tRNA synthetase